MNNVLYQKTLVPAHDAPDGDTATIVYATQENNGNAVFLNSYASGVEFIEWFKYRDAAIERAVYFNLNQ